MAKALIADMLRAVHELDGQDPAKCAYHERHEIQSAGILTVTDDDTADLIAQHLHDRIVGKVVVEIGAGIGLLACHLAGVARKVYAIESDPRWTETFLMWLYAEKPKNLTFIFGTAEDAPPFSADVALFCTHSGHAALYAAASRFAPVVIDVYDELLTPEKRAWRDRVLRRIEAGGVL